MTVGCRFPPIQDILSSGLLDPLWQQVNRDRADSVLLESQAEFVKVFRLIQADFFNLVFFLN